jgi:hypothetical protein
MNERIKELAEQAGITTNLDTDFFETNPNKWVDYYSEKFAELIVRECAQLVLGLPTDSMGYRSADQKIKNHFGVE